MTQQKRYYIALNATTLQKSLQQSDKITACVFSSFIVEKMFNYFL